MIVRDAGDVSYRAFATTDELEQLVLEDLAVLLSETFQSQWTPQLPEPLPPLPAIPTAPTRLVGRHDELAELRQLVPHERLVTLTGPGGIGKARLALEIASELAPQYADGTTFIGLASLEDPGLVAGSIANALRVRGEGPGELLETFKDHTWPNGGCCWCSTTSSTFWRRERS